ncbi:MAG: flagellar protein FlgN [Firmicutes bacterium]|nr:flagellar protein FlgN [Bacillota bacterium]
MSLDQMLEQVQLLEKLVQLYSALNELTKRKEKALSLADVESLDNIITAEQALILNIAEVEKRRFASQKELAAAWGLPINQMTLSAIIEHSDTKIAAQCQQAGQELVTTLAELKERNDRCQVVIKGALEVVQQSLDKASARPVLMDQRV